MLGNSEAISVALSQLPGVNLSDMNTQISASAAQLTLTFQVFNQILLLFMNEREQYFYIIHEMTMPH
jgi:hypothetical protein